jgi:predicted Zn-dependent protease
LAGAGSSEECEAAAALEERYGGIHTDNIAQARLDRVGAKLVEAAGPAVRKYSIHLLSCQRLNALSLPTGRIYVTAGLYKQLDCDELLAAALAHELAHIVSKDGLRPRSCLQGQLDKEIAADRLGARFLARAGYNPQAMADLVRLLETQQRPGWAQERAAALAGMQTVRTRADNPLSPP